MFLPRGFIHQIHRDISNSLLICQMYPWRVELLGTTCRFKKERKTRCCAFSDGRSQVRKTTRANQSLLL